MIQRCRRCVAMVFAAAAGAASLHAQAPQAPQLTPGAIALLANSQDPLATDTLRRALGDPNPDVRRAAARVASVAHPEVFDTLRHALATEQDTDVSVEFVKDLMALGGAQSEPLVESFARKAGADAIAKIAEWFARMDAAQFTSRMPRWAEVSGVASRMAGIVGLATLTHPVSRDSILDVWKPLATPAEYGDARREPPKLGGPSVMQTPTDLVARLIGDTLAAARCPTGDFLESAMVTFGPDGRPRSIEVPKGLSAGCLSALTALARLSTADEADPAQQPHRIVVPMWKTYHACASAPSSGPTIRSHEPLEGVTSPRLIKEVKPDYNREGMQQRLEGIVELEGVVSPAGCVSSMKIIRSLGVLDVQAMKAVLQWRFDPARTGDIAVACIVNIELTFTLRAR